MKGKIFMLRKYDKEWLEELCKNSYSLAEVLKKQEESPEVETKRL